MGPKSLAINAHRSKIFRPAFPGTGILLFALYSPALDDAPVPAADVGVFDGFSLGWLHAAGILLWVLVWVSIRRGRARRDRDLKLLTAACTNPGLEPLSPGSLRVESAELQPLAAAWESAIQGWRDQQASMKGSHGEQYDRAVAEGAEIRARLERRNEELQTVIEQLNRSNIELAETVLTANRLAKETQAAYVAKSEFLATMSHELRTPLNAVIGFSRLLQESRLDEEQAGFSSAVLSSAEHLHGIINDVLDYASMEGGVGGLDASPLSIPELMADVFRDLVTPARARGIEVEVEIEPSLPEIVRSDRVRLLKALRNIAENAFKFTQAGWVRATVSGRLLHAAGPEREMDLWEIEFAFQDTGIGIDPGKKDLVFKPFTQADSTSTRQHGGVGMGLALSRKWIEALRGSITLTSTPGVGSTFRVILNIESHPSTHRIAGLHRPDGWIERKTTPNPAGAGQEASTAAGGDVTDRGPAEWFRLRLGQPERTRGSLNILVVGEDIDANPSLVDLLLRIGHHPESVFSARHVAVLGQDRQFDVIFVREQGPGSPCWQTLSVLRSGQAGPANRHIPAIAFSRPPSPPLDRAECQQWGYSGCLDDLRDEDQVRAVIADVLSLRKP